MHGYWCALTSLASRLKPSRKPIRPLGPRAAFEPLEGRALMSGGTFDALSGLIDGCTAAAAADGSVVVVGSRYTAGVGTELAVARLNPSGALDPTFGTNGVATAHLGGMYDSATDVVVTPDGKILVSAFVQVHGPPPGDMSDFGVVRFNADGTLDTSFGGGDGFVTVNVSAGMSGGADAAYALALDADSRIVLAGYVSYRVPETLQSASGFAAARLNPDGSLDETFGSGGQVITVIVHPNGAASSARDVEVLPDGRLFVSGYRGGPTEGQVTSVRYNADGSLDASYGDGGILYADELYVMPGLEWPAPGAPDDPAPVEAAVTVSVPRAVSRTPVVRRGAYFKFKVTYASESGAPIDLSSLGNGDLTVTGPGGYSADAEMLRAKARRHGTVVKATYRAAAPGGRFDASDNGRYALLLAPSAVTEVDADGGTGEGCEVGAFLVRCRAAPIDHSAATDLAEPRRVTESVLNP